MARQIINDQEYVQQGCHADVNFVIKFKDWILSPLLLAIQCYQENQGETNIIEELLANEADINAKE